MLPSADRVPELLESFEKFPAQSRQQLIPILEGNPAEAITQGLAALNMLERTRGAEFFVSWLIQQNLLLPALCDSGKYSMDEAVAALRVAMRIEPGYDIEQLQVLSENGNTESLTRMLDLAAKTRLSSRLLPVLQTLRQHPNPFLQSKAELLLKRVEQASAMVRRRLSDPDPRTQADAVELLWGETTREAREAFRQAVRSKHSRVAGNGLYGLYLSGDSNSIPLAFDIAKSSLMRPAAIWFMAETCDARFLPWLADAMGTSDERERAQIFQAIRRIRDRRTHIHVSGKLRPHLLLAARHSSGDRILRFSIVGQNGTVQRKVSPTQVVIAEGQHTVTEFQFRASEAAKTLKLTIAIAEGSRSPTCMDTMIQSPDSCRVATYPDTVRFDRLLNGTAKSGNHCDIVLVGEELPPVPDMAAQIEWLRNNTNVRVHTVLPDQSSGQALLQVEALARGSGGLAVRHDGAPDAAVEQVVSGLVHTFEVKYRVPGNDESLLPQVNLQIYSPYGFGESSTVLTPRAD